MKKSGLIVLIVAIFVLFGVSASAQEDKPLGDAARAERAAKSSAPKSAKVTTNDDVPSSPAISGGTLSAPKQAFCDELRRRKDPAAEASCLLLALDMGAEYETLTARAFELGKGLCAANHGRLPTNVRRDSALGPQACELATLYTRFMELMGGLMKTQNVAESELNAVRQEHFTELTSDVPDLRNFAAFSPEEKRRFRDIEEKYRPREEEKQKIVDQIRTRGVRFLLDNALWEKICDFSTSGQTERRPAK